MFNKLATCPALPCPAHVFSSPTPKYGYVVGVIKPHAKALSCAKLADVSLHGLRRSFSTLSEWLEIPIGVVAQIQGHKPSAIAEKHYKRRPIDLLRMHHEKLEAWMLEEGNVNWKANCLAVVDVERCTSQVFFVASAQDYPI